MYACVSLKYSHGFSLCCVFLSLSPSPPFPSFLLDCSLPFSPLSPFPLLFSLPSSLLLSPSLSCFLLPVLTLSLIFSFFLTHKHQVTEDGDEHTRVSRINLIDLAGSERSSVAQTTGQRLKVRARNLWCGVLLTRGHFQSAISSGRSKHQSLLTHFGQSHFLAVGEVAGKAEARLHSLSGLHPYMVDVWGMGRHRGIKAATKIRMVVLQRWLAYFWEGVMCYSLGDFYLSATGAKLLLYLEIVIG